MADISDEAVQAAVAAGDHLVNDEWVRDMLAAALPLVEPGSVLANLLDRIHDLEEAFESASKCADMAVTRVRKLEDGIRQHRLDHTRALGHDGPIEKRLWALLDEEDDQ